MHNTKWNVTVRNMERKSCMDFSVYLRLCERQTERKRNAKRIRIWYAD